MQTTKAAPKQDELPSGMIVDSLGRVRRHSSRFNTAAMVREMRARLANQHPPRNAAENCGHWLEVQP